MANTYIDTNEIPRTMLPGAGEFAKVATDANPGATGSFAYTAAAGDGSYGFYTVAFDKAGNREDAPTAADASTLVDAPAPARRPKAGGARLGRLAAPQDSWLASCAARERCPRSRMRTASMRFSRTDSTRIE